jgi:enoyl-CoA hydratase
MEAIGAALKQDGSEFALATLKALFEKSPTALKVTLELIRRARNSKSLKECLIREYNSALTVFTSAEFVEGVRAAIIDKDRNPKWAPERIEDVTPDIVERYFAPNGKYKLVFPD